MKYKVGDKVLIKSIDWYNENKDEYGYINCGSRAFFTKMSNWCGKIATIKEICKTNYYRLEEYDFDWTDEMIEGLVEEEIIDIDDFQDDNEIIDVIDEYVHRLKNNECQINLPEGYQFTDENGNVINATKIVLEKKKKEYPKTYEECRKIMDIDTGFLLTSYDLDFWKGHLLSSLQKLLICRDAYWKIAGDEMGLNRSWKPDYDSGVNKYGIICLNGVVQESNPTTNWERHLNKVLDFPTAEMRDAFYENFKELIEQCKELL